MLLYNQFYEISSYKCFYIIHILINYLTTSIWFIRLPVQHKALLLLSNTMLHINYILKLLFIHTTQTFTCFLSLSRHINGWMQDCSNSTANALELLQSCAKPLTCPARLQPIRKVSSNQIILSTFSGNERNCYISTSLSPRPYFFRSLPPRS